MQDPVYSVVVFAAMCVSATIGFFIHSRLSEKHRSPESIALVQLMITLLVTFTAIVTVNGSDRNTYELVFSEDEHHHHHHAYRERMVVVPRYRHHHHHHHHHHHSFYRRDY